MDSQLTETLGLLDKYISPVFRANIEKTYYEKINANAYIDEAIKDPLFRAHPFKHISFYNDHGVVHVRDVSMRTLRLLDQLNGLYFGKRSSARLEFMKGFGAMLAYVHDIGMVETKSLDHDLHAQASAQMIFSDYFDTQLSILWDENSGNVPWRITRLAYKKAISQVPRNVLREMLALSGAHAREAVSISMINNLPELRQKLQEMIELPLEYQWLMERYQIAEREWRASENLDPSQREKYKMQKNEWENKFSQYGGHKKNQFLSLYYQNFREESFQWLLTENEEAKEFVEDIIDTLRVLRCANASRQRGEKLRATGGHQIFLDHHSGCAIYAVQTNHKLFLLENKDTLLSGEVNLSSTEFTQSGDLRISFYRGRFDDADATKRAVFNAAIAVNEVQEDMIGSFRQTNEDFSKKWQSTNILLENCDDNLEFTSEVKAQLLLLNPSLKDTVRVVPSLQNASEQERNRYLNAKELNWDLKTENEMLERIAASGHKIQGMQAQAAFSHVKCADISSGEVLMQAGTLGSFVYVPLQEGLTGYPLGGYAPFHAKPFIPLGNVGVIRGDMRNATIVAESALQVLIIPREVYLKHWHNTYEEQEFIALLSEAQLVAKRS